MTIRVVLADDQALFREGLRTVLSTYPEIEVVGEAADGAEAAKLVAALAPDVVLMDLRMPRVSGAEATRLILASGRRTPIIVLTTFDDDESVFDALRAGAVGYLLKDTSSSQLVEAIHAACRGESVLQPSVAAKVVTEFARLADLAPRRDPAADLGLSSREVAVLRLLAGGASNKEIAVALDIAEGTVKNHLTSIFGKLGVQDRVKAALRAREVGLLDG